MTAAPRCASPPPRRHPAVPAPRLPGAMRRPHRRPHRRRHRTRRPDERRRATPRRGRPTPPAVPDFGRASLQAAPSSAAERHGGPDDRRGCHDRDRNDERQPPVRHTPRISVLGIRRRAGAIGLRLSRRRRDETGAISSANASASAAALTIAPWRGSRSLKCSAPQSNPRVGVPRGRRADAAVAPLCGAPRSRSVGAGRRGRG